jgi:hypothetical protein
VPGVIMAKSISTVVKQNSSTLIAFAAGVTVGWATYYTWSNVRSRS